MADLLKLVGLQKLKHEAVNAFKSALALDKLSEEVEEKNAMALNYCFMGNPGTGKTTVARLFAGILSATDLRDSAFVQCTTQNLKDNGAREFRSALKKVNGGVLFIDEAHELSPVDDSKGRPIVGELLAAAEDNRDSLSIILAGYEDDLQG